MLIVIIIWELFVSNKVAGNLQLKNTYLSWKDSVLSCGTIATLQNTPLNSSDWSKVELDGEGAWVGTFYKDTPFYWTRGDLSPDTCMYGILSLIYNGHDVVCPLSELDFLFPEKQCFHYDNDAVRDVPQKSFYSIAAEKCALYCKSEASSVKYIALQDAKCYCLDEKPEREFQHGCKTNCTNVKNERCGSVREKSLFAYRRFADNDDESGIKVLWNRTNLDANCFTILVDGTGGKRQIYLDQGSCSSRRPFICQRGGNYSIENNWMPFDNASSYCIENNKALAYISLNDTIINRLNPSTNYWIGLRRFTTQVSVVDGKIPLYSINFCTAVTRNPVTTKTKNCGTPLKRVCREGTINTGTTATSTKIVNSEGKRWDDNHTERTANISYISTTKKNQRAQQNSGSSSLGAVVGGITAVILLALIVILVFCIYKRKAKSLKRTPSYREPQIEYSSKRKDSEFTVLNTVSNNNKVNTPPSKPVRRTKSGKGSMKGTEYENIVLELEDPKLLKKAVSQGSNGSCRVSSTKIETVDNEYSRVDARSSNRLKRNDQNQEMTSEQGNYNDSGEVPKAETSVNNIYGLGDENEAQYDVMDRENLRKNEVVNPDYDHMDNVLNSTGTSAS